MQNLPQSTEYLDVLDLQGQPTREKLPRDEVHKRGLPHASVHIWIVNSKGEVLSQFRAPEKTQYANVWHVSVAGHVSADSNILQTANNEAKEEIGLDLEIDRMIDLGIKNVKQIVPETGEMDNEFITVFVYKEDKLTDLALQTSEVKSCKWISLSELEADIKDPEKRKIYLNHDPSYYLSVIEQIRKLIAEDKLS